MDAICIKDLKKDLKREMDDSRYEHTLGVMYTSAALAMRYEYDMERAMLAGLMHDCAKCIPNAKKLKQNMILMMKKCWEPFAGIPLESRT